jgi:YegS/Rv2252/BmrU family lipid kinase
MKALLLYNTASGRGRINSRLNEIITLFTKAGYEVTPNKIEFSKNPFEGYEDTNLVVICGGDGTVNFVINALKEKDLDPEIGIIPAGTANDFAYALGMKSDIIGAAQQIINSKVRRIDCGKVNDKYFVNVLSFGVLTTTSQQTSDREKHIIGRLAYLRTGFVDRSSTPAMTMDSSHTLVNLARPTMAKMIRLALANLIRLYGWSNSPGLNNILVRPAYDAI